MIHTSVMPVSGGLEVRGMLYERGIRPAIEANLNDIVFYHMPFKHQDNWINSLEGDLYFYINSSHMDRGILIGIFISGSNNVLSVTSGDKILSESLIEEIIYRSELERRQLPAHFSERIVDIIKKQFQ